METRIPISTKTSKIRGLLVCTGAIALFALCTGLLDLDITKFLARLGNAGTVLSRMMAVDFSRFGEILAGMLLSISIAAAALFVGFLISLVLAFLAADNIAPNKLLAAAIKGIVAVIRAVPALIWILMVVASIGFGSSGGMIGMIFPTVGYLTKSFIASTEELGYNTVEAMRATGCGWLTTVTKGLVPALVTPFLSWLAIRAEGNIAESINLGMVGITGIGSMLMKAIGKYDYPAITGIILVIFATMVLVELLVNRAKKSIQKA